MYLIHIIVNGSAIIAQCSSGDYRNENVLLRMYLEAGGDPDLTNSASHTALSIIASYHESSTVYSTVDDNLDMVTVMKYNAELLIKYGAILENRYMKFSRMSLLATFSRAPKEIIGVFEYAEDWNMYKKNSKSGECLIL